MSNTVLCAGHTGRTYQVPSRGRTLTAGCAADGLMPGASALAPSMFLGCGLPSGRRVPASIAALILAAVLAPSGLAVAQGGGPPPPPEQEITGSDFLSADPGAARSAGSLFGVEVVDPHSEQRGWSGQAQLGFAAATGNTDNTSLNAAVRATYRSFPWRHILTGELLFSEDDGSRTAERYAAAYKINYFFNQRLFTFGFIGADRDKFADIDLRYSAVGGLGYGLIQTERQNLDLELGVGWRQTSYVSDLEDTDSVVGHFALRYTGQLTDNTSVRQDILLQSGDDNTFTQSVTALQVAMNSRLAVSVSFTVLNNSDPPEGFDSTDTFTSVNLVADF